MKVRCLIIYVMLFFGACVKDTETYKIEVSVNPGFDTADLSWTNPFDNDHSVLYQIFLNDEKITQQEGEKTYTLLNLPDDQTFTGYISALHLDDGRSARGDFSFNTRKREPFGGFDISISNLTGNQVEFTWQSPVIPEGGILYDIHLNDSLIFKDVNIRNKTIGDLEPETPYTLAVVAKNRQGSQSEVSLKFNSLKQGAVISRNFDTFGSLRREYCIYQPSGQNNQKLPMVIFLHGYGGVVWPEMIEDNLVRLAEQENFLLLMPQAHATPGSEPSWDAHNIRPWSDDAFIDNLIDRMIGSYNANDQQIYVSGFSNGGFMTFFLSQKLEHRIAAIAPIAGLIDHTIFSRYSLQKPMPLCYFHGTADSIVTVKGGAHHVSFDRILEFFLPHNNITVNPVISELPNTIMYDGSTVTLFQYKTSSGSGDILYYRINNGNHSIPGKHNWANKDISAWEEMWKFFKIRKLGDK
jgi:poly(3-hydroxybutyrate) depolymerase